jgi:hypothetical protein
LAQEGIRLRVADEIQVRGLQALTAVAHGLSLPGPGR